MVVGSSCLQLAPGFASVNGPNKTDACDAAAIAIAPLPLNCRCKGRPGSEYVLRAQAAQESPFRCCTNPYCSRNAIVQDLGTIEIKPVCEHKASHCCLHRIIGQSALWQSTCLAAHADTQSGDALGRLMCCRFDWPGALPLMLILWLIWPRYAARAWLQGKEQRSPKLKACTPARAGYTADLRDASLAAAGATGERSHTVQQFV